MAYRKDAKNFYAEVDSAVNEAFKKQWKRGQIKNDATTAALRVWIALPRYIQAEIMNNPPKAVYNFLVENLLDAELVKFLRSLSPKERETVIQAVKRTRSKISQSLLPSIALTPCPKGFYHLPAPLYELLRKESIKYSTN
jgi:hypothetical protein